MGLFSGLFETRDELRIKAVHDQDLEEFLSSLGKLEDVRGGIFSCVVCDRAITLENIGKIFGEEGEVKFVCDSHQCMQEA